MDAIIGRLNRFLAGWVGYFRHGNSARSFDKLQSHAKTRIAIFLSNKHQRGTWFGRRIVYADGGGEGRADVWDQICDGDPKSDDESAGNPEKRTGTDKRCFRR